MKMKLAILTHSHQLGTDIILQVVPDDWNAQRTKEYVRHDLEDAYGKNDVAEATEKYGGVEYCYFLDEKDKAFFTHPDGKVQEFTIKVVPR
jgi:hypothetical protein